MRAFVNVKRGLLSESLEAHVALVGSLAGVGAVVNLEVLLAGEGGWALEALERAALHCRRQKKKRLKTFNRLSSATR